MWLLAAGAAAFKASSGAQPRPDALPAGQHQQAPSTDQLAALLQQQEAAAREQMRHPRVRVTDLEAQLGTRYTAETLVALKTRYPGVRFVWLMGADNLGSFHHWDRWETIMKLVPVGVLARPGEQLKAGLSPAARRFARWRLPQTQAKSLPFRRPPAWVLLTGRMLDLSSTELRALGIWRR